MYVCIFWIWKTTQYIYIYIFIELEHSWSYISIIYYCLESLGSLLDISVPPTLLTIFQARSLEYCSRPWSLLICWPWGLLLVGRMPSYCNKGWSLFIYLFCFIFFCVSLRAHVINYCSWTVHHRTYERKHLLLNYLFLLPLLLLLWKWTIIRD